MARLDKPILVLGAGVNGAAIARELAINGVSVVLVDVADICTGASAHSSRLIHGGLRYLEFAEFDLVRESLAERGRLLDLSPQFVRPLRLFIPVAHRGGGLLISALRFFKLSGSHRPPRRGLWLVRMGLWLYDRYARDRRLPNYDVHRVGDVDAVAVDASVYRWECSYSDAQIRYPERFILAMLADACRAAADSGATLQVFNYHRATLDGAQTQIRRVAASTETTSDAPPEFISEIAAVINATGAWVDRTLERLDVASPQLMGGTKGSHFITYHTAMHDALAGRGVYLEADDGRPVFILPLADAVLVGTTDEHYEGDPGNAVASDVELNYLVTTVNRVMPQIGFTRDDVAWHYSGVRPLPYVGKSTPAGITRRHRLEQHTSGPVPIFSVIGGKLTTCRALAEETTATVLKHLGQLPTVTSQARLLPGAEDYPDDEAGRDLLLAELESQGPLTREQLDTLWPLYGTRLREIVHDINTNTNVAGCQNIPDTTLPTAIVRWMIEHEWAETLDDLVDRRLMLLYAPQLTTRCLRHLAEQLAAADKLPADRIDVAVAATTKRLVARHGKHVLE